jgi:hypothetical protein
MEATSKAVVQARVRCDGLSLLKRRFAQWRAGRKVGARIPRELWAGAVDLVGEHGACRVAAELHLDYAVLKRRAGLTGGKVRVQEAPRFVELFAPAGSATPAGALRPQCVVELDNARGAKMRVELSGQGLCGLSALCSAFWAA